MTIKRRLILSNILMIVIPVIIAVIIAFSSSALTWYWINHTSNKENNIYTSYTQIVNKMVKNMNTEKGREKIQKSLRKYRANAVIYNKNGKTYTFGREKLKYQGALLKDSKLIKGEGFASIKDDELYTINIKINKNTYKVCILYNISTAGYDSKYYHALDMQFVVVVLATLISIVLAVILANRYLSRFVFRKINRSLDLLADGVHEINEGNLDFRIVYKDKDEFTPVCKDFNHMAAKLSQSIELIHKQEQNRKELIAGISHDLRSPLTSIKAYVEGLIDGVAKTPQAQQNYMQMIKTKAEDIDHMVSKLFLFSKMDMGDYPYDPETLFISQEIESYVKATEKEYNDKGLRIRMETLKSDIKIYSDPLQLRRILANILENSLKYKEKPEGQVWIRFIKKEEQVCIIIEDDGPGVPEDELGKLFQVFYRSDRSRSNPNKGSGLGLAITAKAVSYMKGNIYAECREQGGLRIMIEIPCIKEGGENEENSNH